jgi:sortase A
MDVRSRFLLLAERTCWAIGLAGLMWWCAFQVRVATQSRSDIARFDSTFQVAAPDQSLWSPQRLSAWRKLIGAAAPRPLAVLRIPKIHLEVAVLPGSDDATLDRAVGHVEETALPGADGNMGIAGHRDGFFRGLKDIAVGDRIELDTVNGMDSYRIVRTWIVEPEDVSVLDPTPTPTITLVTCYPFYFVGSAPQRFIVRAERVAHSDTNRGRAASPLN